MCEPAIHVIKVSVYEARSTKCVRQCCHIEVFFFRIRQRLFDVWSSKTNPYHVLGSCYNSVIIICKYHKLSAVLMCAVFGSTRDEAS